MQESLKFLPQNWKSDQRWQIIYAFLQHSKICLTISLKLFQYGVIQKIRHTFMAYFEPPPLPHVSFSDTGADPSDVFIFQTIYFFVLKQEIYLQKTALITLKIWKKCHVTHSQNPSRPLVIFGDTVPYTPPYHHQSVTY